MVRLARARPAGGDGESLKRGMEMRGLVGCVYGKDSQASNYLWHLTDIAPTL